MKMYPFMRQRAGEQGSSCSRDSVQEELSAAFAVEQARKEVGDDDETQPPSPGSSHVLKSLRINTRCLFFHFFKCGHVRPLPITELAVKCLKKKVKIGSFAFSK